MEWVIVVVAGGALVGLALAGRRQRAARAAAAATVSVEVDGWGVRRTLGDGRREEIGWDEVAELRVTVLPKGPWPDPVKLVLDGGGDRGVIVPLHAAEDNGVLAGLGRLPGLDYRHLQEVLGAERPGEHTVWRRTST
jgi:hypothetical protein